MKKIFIIHGWSYSTEKWEPLIKLLEEFHLQPILLKVPGLTAPLDRPWKLDDYVEWLDNKLADEKMPVVLGHSNGGRIALAFASKYRDRLGKLILIDSAGIYHNELSVRLKRQLFKSVSSVGKSFTKSQFLQKLLYKIARENDYHQANDVMKETMTNLIVVDLKPELPHITTPGLIIWGRNDKSTPFSDGKMMAQLLPSATLKIIEGAKHSPQFTHPKQVAKLIYEYL